MGEPIGDILDRLAIILHWLGKYHEANQLRLLVRLCRVHNFQSAEELEIGLAKKG